MEKLVYGENYLCFVGSCFIGTATFIDDEYIGDSFSRLAVHKKRGLEEEILIPEWVLAMAGDC